MAQPIGVMYATAGGRYPFLAGVAEALESYLIKQGYNIVFRMGASGGSLVSALNSSGMTFPEWVGSASSPQMRAKMKIGGWKYLSNLWNYARRGGFLKSEDLIEIFGRTLNKPLATPTYAVSWCSSSEKPVAFRLEPETIASRIAASCSLPVGLTPVQIQNKTLEERIQIQLGVQDDPDGFSTFRDGGLCPGFPLTLIEGMSSIPVIVVCIDYIAPNKSENHVNVFHKILANQMRVKILDNVNEIASRRHLSVFCVPSPEFINRKYAVKFDLTEEEGVGMYEIGKTMAEAQLWLHGISLPKAVAVPTPKPIAVQANVNPEAQDAT